MNCPTRVFLSLSIFLSSAFATATPPTGGPVHGGEPTTEQEPGSIFFRRARFIFSGVFAMPSEILQEDLDVPVLGGSLGIEFGSRSKVRALFNFSGMGLKHKYARPSPLYTNHAGIRWYPGKKIDGFHFDLLWGLDLGISSITYINYLGTVTNMTLASTNFSCAGGIGVVKGPAAISFHYQIIPDYNPWNEPSKWYGRKGFAIVRIGFSLGGAEAAVASPAARPTKAAVARQTGSRKSQLAWQTARADSLDNALSIRDSTLRGVMEQNLDMAAEISHQKNLVAQANALAAARLDSLQTRPVPAPQPTYSVLHENPGRFGAVRVYTVLHPFSSTEKADTFRVVTTIPPNGGFKHELQIATVTGKLYKEEFYAQPLPGTTPRPGTDEERELLRVRMALSPDAFLARPVTQAAKQLSDERDARDLVFQLDKAQFNRVFTEGPPVGFRFQSDEQLTKVLVPSAALDRIVNIQPE